jgi:hypothetical protein
MPPEASSKRKRQYGHVKESAKKRGGSTKRAKEIAARTVNKQRAESGEARGRSRSSGQGRSKEQLYGEAKRLGIEGRSKMSKAELQRAVGRRK